MTIDAPRSARRLKFTTVVFDVDSTLAAIEGIDWLAARRGPETEAFVRVVTERAMNGSVPLEAVYAERLARIRPTRQEVEELGHAYVASVQPGARFLCEALQEAGCTVLLVSGGLRDAILPLAAHLGVRETHVHAVEIDYDAQGAYAGLRGAPTLATQQGKPRLVHELLPALSRPIVMIGDGSTDAATRGVTDAFIAYTGVARRPNVVAVADAEAVDFPSLQSLLFREPTRL